MTYRTGKLLEGSDHGISCNKVTIKPKLPKCLFSPLCFLHTQLTLQHKTDVSNRTVNEVTK